VKLPSEQMTRIQNCRTNPSDFPIDIEAIMT